MQISKSINDFLRFKNFKTIQFQTFVGLYENYCRALSIKFKFRMTVNFFLLTKSVCVCNQQKSILLNLVDFIVF